MDQVEAAIGKADLQAACAPFRDPAKGLVEHHDLAVGRQQIADMQRLGQLIAAHGRRAGLGHDQAGGDIGEARGVGQIGAAGERHGEDGDGRVAGA